MAINRYQYTEVIKDENGKRFFRPTIFPQINVNENDTVITVREGDRLDLLAHRFYNDSTLWWIIAEANHLVNGSLFVEPGTIIRIPSNVAEIMSELQQLQSSW
jgi:nucleoid-associated protein YgaU